MGYLLITKVPFDTSITSLKLSPLMYFNILATISALACNKSLGPPMQEFSVTVGFGDLLLFFTFPPPSHPPPAWYNAHRKGVVFVSAKSSGDIVYCLKTDDPNRPLVITQQDNGTVAVNCLFLNCPYFDRCKLSNNPTVRAYLARS